MFRLAAPLIISTVALNDETSLMQGLKPQQVNQKEDKSKAISNLLETAQSMLKNGATPDVVEFAQATLAEIQSVVEPAIINASNTDQGLVDSTFAMFAQALEELQAGNNRILAFSNEERTKSRLHKTCREQEEEACGVKRECDYELYRKWRKFVDEESELRRLSDEVENWFCAEDANGTAWLFRDHAVTLFPPWLEQKPIVERYEEEYDLKRPECETFDAALDDKTAECDAVQGQLDEAACDHAQEVREVSNRFAQDWYNALYNYQRIMDEVHCLEIDRWKEWRSLRTVSCLLDRTTERSGRPCDETTGEIVTEVARCEEVQIEESIDHLRITYHEVPYLPPHCDLPPWEENRPDIDLCLPQDPQHCGSHGYFNQEYASLWVPPAEPFFAPAEPELLSSTGNSHCNPRPDCVPCVVGPPQHVCGLIFGGAPPTVEMPLPEHECHPATRETFMHFDLFGEGHFTPPEA